MAINPMDASAKDVVLDVVRTERGKFYQIIDVPENWEAPTRSGHWEERDLVGHMIDVTEGYLTRWDMSRREDPAPAALGLPVMAQELDRVALTFRKLPREEAISMIVNGFCKDVFNQLPMEFAVEAQKLLGLKLEGSVG